MTTVCQVYLTTRKCWLRRRQKASAPSAASKRNKYFYVLLKSTKLCHLCFGKGGTKPTGSSSHLMYLLVQNRLAVELDRNLLLATFYLQTILAPKGACFVQHLLRCSSSLGYDHGIYYFYITMKSGISFSEPELSKK